LTDASTADTPLVHGTLRMNALIFGAILGVMTGAALLALALAADRPVMAPTRLPVILLGVFLPGYQPGLAGGAAGLVWGIAAGGLAGAGVYWINARAVLGRLDSAFELERPGDEFPAAALRLRGLSLGLAVGAVAALLLVVATNWLVLRGTAAHSVHARLLAQILPGYDVTPAGSLAGACGLFAIMFVLGLVFAGIYNALAALRGRGATSRSSSST
jgi:hypothetical protein